MRKRGSWTPEEDAVHRSVHNALCTLVAPPGVVSRYGVVWFSVESRNAASVIEGACRKARGVVAGIPDMHFYHAGRCLMIELKRSPKGKFSDAQAKLRAALAVAGTPTELCWSIDGVLAALSAHGIPHSASSHTEALLAEAERMHFAAIEGVE